jgi:hypothetical protein
MPCSVSSGCDTEGYCILRTERTLTVLSDFHTDVIVVADDIKGKGHLAEVSSVQNKMLQRTMLIFTRRLMSLF